MRGLAGYEPLFIFVLFVAVLEKFRKGLRRAGRGVFVNHPTGGNSRAIETGPGRKDFHLML